MNWKIIFNAVNNITDSKYNTIFKAFKEICMYHTKSFFRIKTLHVDGKFDPLQFLIHYMKGRLKTNIESYNEHVPDIKRWFWVEK